MELSLWWLSIAILCAVMISLIIAKRRHQKHGEKITGKLPLANSFRLTRLPAYQKYLQRYTWLIRGALSVVMVAVLALVILAGRPTSHSVTYPETKNRDIILCLDVSGSMVEADAELTKIYAELSKGFKGERLGMVIFDSSPITVFPLTNDYDFIRQQLEGISEALGKGSKSDDFKSELSRRFYDLISGVNEGDGSSLIGDGLASCVSRFDRLDTKRSRSIIFGTDNYLSGNPVVTLKEAAQLAKDKDIRIYGINPADYSSSYADSQPVKEFKEAILLTNGDYYKLDNVSAASSIIKKVTEQDATRFKGSPQIVYTDQPQIFLCIFLFCFVALLVISWRLNI